MADAAPTSTTTDIVLTDPAPSTDADFGAPTGDVPAPEQAKPAEAKAEGEKDAKQEDPDKLILSLLTQRRQQAARDKALAKREQALKAVEDKAAKADEYEALFAGARANPETLLTRVAEATGLDVDTVVEWYTARKSGGQPALPADHAVKSLQAEVAALKAKLDEKDNVTEQQRQAQEGDAHLQKYLTDLKAVAAAAPDDHKLFNAEPEANAIEAFDLMYALHQAGKPITHAEAVKRIEAVLREDTDKRAPLLGYQRASSTNETRQQPTTTQTPATATRAVTANAAPFETASPIRSDEEIRNDWLRSFPGQH